MGRKSPFLYFVQLLFAYVPPPFFLTNIIVCGVKFWNKVLIFDLFILIDTPSILNFVLEINNSFVLYFILKQLQIVIDLLLHYFRLVMFWVFSMIILLLEVKWDTTGRFVIQLVFLMRMSNGVERSRAREAAGRARVDVPLGFPQEYTIRFKFIFIYPFNCPCSVFYGIRNLPNVYFMKR